MCGYATSVWCQASISNSHMLHCSRYALYISQKVPPWNDNTYQNLKLNPSWSNNRTMTHDLCTERHVFQTLDYKKKTSRFLLYLNNSVYTYMSVNDKPSRIFDYKK